MSTWITVLIRIGAVVMVLGLSWNLKDIIIDSAIGSTSAQHYAALIYRVIGIVLAFVLLVTAPTIVRTFQDGFRTPLVSAPYSRAKPEIKEEFAWFGHQLFSSFNRTSVASTRGIASSS